MTATDTRRLRADAARNRQALMDAAERLFAARGLSVTLDDIAVEAGVNVATAYRHFANKRELAGEFVRRVFDDAARIAEAAAAAEDPWDGITEFFARTLELMVANRGLHDIFTPGYAEEWLDDLDERMEPIVQGLLDRAQKAGVVRADIAPGDLGVLLQMLVPLSDIPHGDPAALIERYLALVLDGLKPTTVALPGSAPAPADVRSSTGPGPSRKVAIRRTRR